MARRNHKTKSHNPKPTRLTADERRAKARNQGYWMVEEHPLFSPIEGYVWWRGREKAPSTGWAAISNQGGIYINETADGEPKEWAYVVAHCYLHLGLGHFQERDNQLAWNVACDVIVARFLAQFQFGKHPLDLPAPDIGAGQTEDTLYEKFCRDGFPEGFLAYGIGDDGEPDMIFEEPQPFRRKAKPVQWERLFGVGLRHAVTAAVEVASGDRDNVYEYTESSRSKAHAARDWCINRFPLLGALAAAFDVIEDHQLCKRMDISVAAVNAEAREIYFNPTAGLDDEEYRFVMAHELLHVGLRHHVRQEGRDHYLWNIACDYVINAWLIEMGIGSMPQFGAMHDPSLHDLSVEMVYDRIVVDMRKYQRVYTLRGKGAGDMLGGAGWWKSREGTTLDDFYRRCLGQGLDYHQGRGRGYLPAGLVEEIRAMNVPPIPWDVELARWFEAHFAPLEKVRSYARPSRRQSATPDIPRPRWVEKPDAEDGRTFGVVLDTSGSMGRSLLAKALGAIASYSMAHEVPAARVVFCDAMAYDQGYMAPQDIAGRVKIKGRGGTILQPGVDLIENAPDFPKDGPMLIITDTFCDHVHAHREHAYLIPEGSKLPFPPRGEVFKVR